MRLACRNTMKKESRKSIYVMTGWVTMFWESNDKVNKEACNTMKKELRKSKYVKRFILGCVSVVGILCSGNSMMEKV